MFVTKNQFFIFLCCISIGAIGKMLSFGFLKIKSKSNILLLKILFDVLTYLLITFLFIFTSFYFKFPSVRAYMILGIMIGIILYDKSLKIILAKLTKRIYNIIEQILRIKRKHTNDRKQI